MKALKAMFDWFKTNFNKNKRLVQNLMRHGRIIYLSSSPMVLAIFLRFEGIFLACYIVIWLKFDKSVPMVLKPLFGRPYLLLLDHTLISRPLDYSRESLDHHPCKKWPSHFLAPEMVPHWRREFVFEAEIQCWLPVKVALR